MIPQVPVDRDRIAARHQERDPAHPAQPGQGDDEGGYALVCDEPAVSALRSPRRPRASGPAPSGQGQAGAKRDRGQRPPGTSASVEPTERSMPPVVITKKGSSPTANDQQRRRLPANQVEEVRGGQERCRSPPRRWCRPAGRNTAIETIRALSTRAVAQAVPDRSKPRAADRRMLRHGGGRIRGRRRSMTARPSAAGAPAGGGPRRAGRRPCRRRSGRRCPPATCRRSAARRRWCPRTSP